MVKLNSKASRRFHRGFLAVALACGLASSARAENGPAMWPEAHFDRAAKNYYDVKLAACRTANIQVSIMTLTEDIDWMDDYLRQVTGLLQAAQTAPAADRRVALRRNELSGWLPLWQRERADMWRWLVELDNKPKCADLAPPAPTAPRVKRSTQDAANGVAARDA